MYETPAPTEKIEEKSNKENDPNQEQDDKRDASIPSQ